MEECNLTTKTTFSEFSAKYGKDERFKGVEKSRERENLFNEHIVDLRRREKEERQAKREQGQRTEKKSSSSMPRRNKLECLSLSIICLHFKNQTIVGASTINVS
jgi:hypothetical protein